MTLDAVKKMYEYHPYPGLGDNLKGFPYYTTYLPEDFASRKNLKILDAGCGTGHITASLGKIFPDADVIGIDLSSASISIAKKLADLHNVKNVILVQGNCDAETLEKYGPFDLIVSMGMIHHNPNPTQTLKDLGKALKTNGYICMHLYGKRLDQGKFDIKHILNLVANDNTVESRFKAYQQLIEFNSISRPIWKKILLMSLYDIFIGIKKSVRNLSRRLRKISWSPGWDYKYENPTSPWVDHFCHPLEYAFEADEVLEMIRQSELTIFKCIGLGKKIKKNIPPCWQEKYKDLSISERIRLNELLLYTKGVRPNHGGSFKFILKKE